MKRYANRGIGEMSIAFLAIAVCLICFLFKGKDFCCCFVLSLQDCTLMLSTVQSGCISAFSKLYRYFDDSLDSLFLCIFFNLYVQCIITVNRSLPLGDFQMITSSKPMFTTVISYIFMREPCGFVEVSQISSC